MKDKLGKMRQNHKIIPFNQGCCYGRLRPIVAGRAFKKRINLDR